MLPPGIGLVGLYIVFMYRAQGCSLAQIRGGGGGGGQCLLSKYQVAIPVLILGIINFKKTQKLEIPGRQLPPLLPPPPPAQATALGHIYVLCRCVCACVWLGRHVVYMVYVCP